jgi:hypothetical protein
MSIQILVHKVSSHPFPPPSLYSLFFFEYVHAVCGPGSESEYMKIWIWIQFQQIWIQNFNYCERLHAPVQLKELGELSLFKEDTNMSLVRSFFIYL